MTSTTTPPSTPQAARQGRGLPPTGLQQQLNGLRDQYNQARSARVKGLGGVGVDVNANAGQNQRSLRSGMTGQVGQPGGQAMEATEGGAQLPMGQTSLQQLAQRLATSYGLAIGRDQLVDSAGNFNFTPDQLAGASGGAETMGTAAAKMNYIASAIQRQQTQESMKKSEAALQAGLGVTSQRSRGSAVEQQQQFYSSLASLYQNQDYEAADFSYFIQKEKMDLEAEMQRKAERLAKKKAKAGFWTGVGMVGLGALTGQWWLAGQGLTQAGASGGEAGYF